MSAEIPDARCEQSAELLPELALGVLTGRERAAALAHVETCPTCAEELEQLSRTADAVVWVAPESEPPVGFEVRLFSRMGVRDDLAQPRQRRLARRSTWVLGTAAAVVALAVGLAIGWSVGSAPGGHHGGAAQAAAALRHNGHTVGHVSTTSGTHPWMVMTLEDAPVEGAVWCRVVTDQGATRTVGKFTVTHGYGEWGAPLPVAPRDIRLAQVVSAGGTVLATATLG